MSTPLVTRTVTITSQGANGQTLTTTYTITGNEEVNFSENLAIGTSVEFTFPIAAYATVQCVDITASSACTIDFNSTGAPAPALSVSPTQPAHWDVNQYAVNNTYWPNPFTANVTVMYITNAAACTLNISVLLLAVA